MEPEITTLGSSIPVPCVQELAKEKTSTVPPRYVRFPNEPPIISDTTSLPQVPVIDMQRLFSAEFMDTELEKLHYASKEWGFFQLINHGVSISLVEKVKVGIQELFNLPMEEKKKLWQLPGDIEGFGQTFVMSEEQKLDWGDMFKMVTHPIHLRKPHLFPKIALPFKDNLDAYSAELKDLAMKILELMAKALGMEHNDMRSLFEEGLGLTILLQVNEMEGLQIRKDGRWISIKPLPNAFIVNIGDILEIVTNGIYRSIEHRATVNSAKERLSVATFYSPSLEADMGPAPSLITPESPALFKRTGVADYFREFLSRELNGRALIDSMRIQKGT
ncbi:protein SRG1-like [Quercus lobata]|uniref:protein SRG1-like n=1 Tax=Quercus lobata TaxID=97700 RepID=UPI001243CE97|nr:protein SRG1-like [Quercus lobata]